MLVSVLTPSHNRAHTLEAAFHSLFDQLVDLEWVVVDDGSTDRTRDLIADLLRKAPFPVRYIHQEHAGVHAARNRGVDLARGEMIALLDSDDMLVAQGLDRVVRHWERVSGRADFAGVSALCVDETGRVVGDRFPADVIDATWHEMVYKYQVHGEKFGLLRTDVLRTHPFPTEPPGFVGEGAVWREIGRGYRMRWVNEAVRVYRLAEPDRICLRPFADNAASQSVAHASVLNDDIRWLHRAPAAFARSAAHLARALFHQGVPPWRQPRLLATWRARALLTMAMPLGWALYRRDTDRSPMSTPQGG